MYRIVQGINFNIFNGKTHRNYVKIDEKNYQIIPEMPNYSYFRVKKFLKIQNKVNCQKASKSEIKSIVNRISHAKRMYSSKTIWDFPGCT